MAVMQILLVLAALAAVVLSMPIDDYVWREDGAYNWVELTQYYKEGRSEYFGGEGFRFSGYLLNVTSQRWLTDADFSESSEMKSLWWHYLVVVVPHDVQYTRNATMWITGGSNYKAQWSLNSPPTLEDEDVFLTMTLAISTHTVAGALFNIPSEHIKFATDPIQKSRGEDAIIAFTWDHFLKYPDQPDWLVRFPMVKGALKSMDAMTDFAAKKFPEQNLQLDYYTVSGASKRGWTTWLCGAVDPNRVKVIIPVVLDAINFQKVEHHQWQSYGGWTFALQDYLDMDIMSRLDDPNMLLLSQNEDPYFFRDRLTMPKLVINAVLDEFQQPDDTRYWWNDMPEPKHFLMIPNAEHSMASGILEVVPAISQYVQHHLKGEVVPEFKWTINNSTGEIVATLNEHGVVHEARVFYAYSCGFNHWDNDKMRRDFRVAMMDNPCTCGILSDGTCANLQSLWSSKTLEQGKDKLGRRTYSAKLDAPGDGRWVAYMIDITYKRTDLFGNDIEPVNMRKLLPNILPKDLTGRLEFTSEVSVWPQTFPYADVPSAQMVGNIV